VPVKRKHAPVHGEAVENETNCVKAGGKQKAKGGKLPSVDEGCKRVLLIAASLIAARRLTQEERVNDSPRKHGLQSANQFHGRTESLREIDRKWAAGNRKNIA